MAEPGFSQGAKVVVEELDDRNWEVREPFEYRGQHDTYQIRSGMETDFASVPRVFVWFLPSYGRYTLAAIVHDHLWRDLAANGAISYIDADGIFRRAMRELGVPFLRRWTMWAAVRWGALVKRGGWHGWWRESWRVALVTVLALPIVGPPAVVVGLGLALFQLLELVTWLPLRAWATVPRAAGRAPAKQVNRPTVDWRS
jgi:hypothetical protein